MNNTAAVGYVPFSYLLRNFVRCIRQHKDTCSFHPLQANSRKWLRFDTSRCWIHNTSVLKTETERFNVNKLLVDLSGGTLGGLLPLFEDFTLLTLYYRYLYWLCEQKKCY